MAFNIKPAKFIQIEGGRDEMEDVGERSDHTRSISDRLCNVRSREELCCLHKTEM